MRELEKTFTGKGEVGGFEFTQIDHTIHGYIYEVNCFGKIYYEVWKRVENKRFGVISRPSSKSFGTSAWTFPHLKLAKAKLQELTQMEISRLSIKKSQNAALNP